MWHLRAREVWARSGLATIHYRQATTSATDRLTVQTSMRRSSASSPVLSPTSRRKTSSPARASTIVPSNAMRKASPTKTGRLCFLTWSMMQLCAKKSISVVGPRSIPIVARLPGSKKRSRIPRSHSMINRWQCFVSNSTRWKCRVRRILICHQDCPWLTTLIFC